MLTNDLSAKNAEMKRLVQELETVQKERATNMSKYLTDMKYSKQQSSY